MKRILLAFGLMVALITPALAQTAPQLAYDTATLAWDAPTTAPGWYLLNCGAADIRINAPATSVKVSTVLPVVGSYTCTLKAANAFGVSAPSNAVTFEVGERPAPPANVRVEAR